ncbi:hypothetical protein EGW08_002781, partial [Elysia chlorotica]
MDSLNEAIIAAVEKRPHMYDKSDSKYSNRSYIARQWKEIGDEVGVDDQTARKKWTSIRDYFQRSCRVQAAAKPGTVVEKHKKWYLFDSLLFLVPHIGERTPSSQIVPLGTAEHSEDSEHALAGENSHDKLDTLVNGIDAASPVPTATTSFRSQANETKPVIPRRSSAYIANLRK